MVIFKVVIVFDNSSPCIAIIGQAAFLGEVGILRVCNVDTLASEKTCFESPFITMQMMKCKQIRNRLDKFAGL